MDMTAIFTTAFVVGFSGAMMPGPLLAATIGESARRGFVAGPLIVLGHALLELSLVILLVLGLASILAGEWVKVFIGLVGGIFLLYFGWTMSRDALKGRVNLNLESEGADPGSGKGMHPVASGFLLSLSNPFWVMWWVTVGLLYITQALQGGLMGITSFYSGHILADTVWFCLVSGAVSGGRRFISQKLYSGVLAVCGLFVTGLGVYFIWDAIKSML